MATNLALWWSWLCLVGLLNLGLWWAAARALRRDKTPETYALRRAQLALSAVYVAVTAFRGFLPRADVQRICLVDSYLSSILVGRTLATFAELCFALQWALFVRALGDDSGDRYVRAVSRVLVPLIVGAEISSWYAVLTTNFLGNALEQSTWTLCGALIASTYLRTWPQADPELRRFLLTTAAVIACFLTFMCSVDIPLYVTRWRADQAAGLAYMPWQEGLRDAAERWIVTHDWDDWRAEAAWMGLYFSVGVWTSLGLTRAPQLARELTPQGSRNRSLHALRR